MTQNRDEVAAEFGPEARKSVDLLAAYMVAAMKEDGVVVTCLADITQETLMKYLPIANDRIRKLAQEMIEQRTERSKIVREAIMIDVYCGAQRRGLVDDFLRRHTERKRHEGVLAAYDSFGFRPDN